MIRAWRLVKKKHQAAAFSGLGARLAGGRWNLPGEAVVYASSSLALAALETLVHLGDEARVIAFVYFELLLPEDLAVTRCARPPVGWRVEPPGDASMRYGSRWLRAGKTAVLDVPSVLVPPERNFVVNPQHSDFARITLSRPRAFTFDPRLWR